jgi:hypothetical protein
VSGCEKLALQKTDAKKNVNGKHYSVSLPAAPQHNENW